MLLMKDCYLYCQYIFVSYIFVGKETLENTEGATKNGQSRETGMKGYTRRRKTNEKHNTTQYVLDTTMRKQAEIT